MFLDRTGLQDTDKGTTRPCETGDEPNKSEYNVSYTNKQQQPSQDVILFARVAAATRGNGGGGGGDFHNHYRCATCY